MDLSIFNSLPADEARTALRPCLDIDRWIDDLTAGRPYADQAALTAAAEAAANPFTNAEVTAALAHHPRIGERAEGPGAEAELSRGEQAGLDPAADTAARLVDANRAYEQRFGRVFLIRAAGRSAEEILSEATRRLENTAAREADETAGQLRQIALLRLRDAVAAPAAAPAKHP
ncbi:2-oxo-4-hydroxy-4-carboxy-5-ureidoimidazoline decarboxylase [Zhihengliuella salsuginis]|uniref:2-oxo-4-hydroxy-4-carboxy-5-ureidoimidazoline decarboxylase n=1 Tax=Zhihengliuella salsuginis TaxID=578222 RepID=A0ABQ3GM99_9MICC|nr:2-oxo-4-hydroxy-4-carboxy-5-ureidoimidazoline decarboxylase [Zhihengliuella salsuginis]GHD12360.1 OHCU decarboxylase [Zhihengliuella salsuginis]